tara:strand:+ start:3625 stop:5136 length:1512 start_codon:yes stop_codon:yes gene_type:complete
MKNLEKLRINELLPEQLRDTAKNLIDFLKVYYTQQNTDSAPTQLIEFINQNQDLDRVADNKFISALSDSIAKDLPKSAYVERTKLLKRLVDYYNIKGTKRSIEIFFKLFFNKNITINEPWDSVLMPSDGRFNKNFFIRVVPTTPTSITDALLSKRVYQRNQYFDKSSSGIIRNIEKEEYDETIHTLYLDSLSISGTFIEGNDLVDENNVVLGKIYRTLSKVNIINGGSNYSIGDRFYSNSNDNTSFQLRVDGIDAEGTITDIKILNPGAGNTSGNLEVIYKDFQIEGNTHTLIYKPVIGAAREAIGVEFSYEFKALVDTFGTTRGIKGRLSDGIVTQDSNFYQKYSYEVVTDLAFSSFRKSFDDLIHPAGYKVFNRIRKETNPPIPFSTENSLVEIKKIGKAVLQPGNGSDIVHIYDGKGDPNVDYSGSPSSDRADEKIAVLFAGGVFRDNYTTLQSRSPSTTEFLYDSETAIAVAKGLPVYPKDNYFMEDFVNDNPNGGGFL